MTIIISALYKKNAYIGKYNKEEFFMTNEIRELVKKYNENHDENEKIKVEHEKKRKSFVEDFPVNKISSLSIEDFVLKKIDGKAAKERGPQGKGTFIYRMEREKRDQTDYEKANGISTKDKFW